jgi:diaminopimelate epimerase
MNKGHKKDKSPLDGDVMTYDFHKYHALGNDYIVIDPNKTKANLPAQGAELPGDVDMIRGSALPPAYKAGHPADLPVNLTPENIKLICHRHLGIGSDGILYGPIFEKDTFHLRIFNPDGSEAEKSGNGIRIFTKYLVDAHYVTGKKILLDTLGGRVGVEVLDEKANWVKVDMGTVTFRSDEIPVSGKSREVVNEILNVGTDSFRVTCLSIGNPHCVIPVEEALEEVVKKMGPLIEHHPLFPNRINMQLLEIVNRSHIKIEIWERGAGYTMASGSSSCAAASAAYRLGLVDPRLKVEMPGGTIEIDIHPDGHVHMTGAVTSVARGEFSEDFEKQLR